MECCCARCVLWAMWHGVSFHIPSSHQILPNLDPVFLFMSAIRLEFSVLFHFFPSCSVRLFFFILFCYNFSSRWRYIRLRYDQSMTKAKHWEWGEKKIRSQPMTVVFFMQSSEYIKSKHFSNIPHFFPSSSALSLSSSYSSSSFLLLLAMWQRKSWHNLQNF